MPKPKKARSPKAMAERASEIYDRLATHYPGARCALDYKTPFQLLVATILSAQCTDKRVNMVTPALFAKYPDAKMLSVANPEELQDMIKSTGFFRNKTKSLLGMSRAVAEQYSGEIPSTMEALLRLPSSSTSARPMATGLTLPRWQGLEFGLVSVFAS